MAKDKTEGDVKAKKEKKDKKEKRSEEDGVSKKSKKDKKQRKSKEPAEALLNQLENEPDSVAVTANGDIPQTKFIEQQEDEILPRRNIPPEALVPFANPLADDKQTKKIFKSVQKAAKHKTLHRGVKEVVKNLRKSTSNAPASSVLSSPSAVVILAADISPMDVISHLPVLCEDHSVPYMFVTSRADLGAASNTKRPTSVVMVRKDKMKKVEPVDEEKECAYQETYSDLVKLVQKAGQNVKV